MTRLPPALHRARPLNNNNKKKRKRNSERWKMDKLCYLCIHIASYDTIHCILHLSGNNSSMLLCTLTGRAQGWSVLVLFCGFCGMTRLKVLLLRLNWILVHRRLLSSISSGYPTTICWFSLFYSRGLLPAFRVKCFPGGDDESPQATDRTLDFLVSPTTETPHFLHPAL